MRLKKLGDIRVRFWIPGNVYNPLISKSRRIIIDVLEKGIMPIGEMFVSTRVVIASNFPSSRVHSDERIGFIDDVREFNVFISGASTKEKFQKLLDLLDDVCRDMERRWIYIENDEESFLFFPDDDADGLKRLRAGQLVKKEDVQKPKRRQL